MPRNPEESFEDDDGATEMDSAYKPEKLDNLNITFGTFRNDLTPEAEDLVGEILEAAEDAYPGSTRKEKWNDLFEDMEEMIQDFQHLYSDEDKQARLAKVRKQYEGLIN
ncbi:MAG TPA: hypothetical protein VGQ87_02950 [Patescibacteria group bacterium]|jgi:hypothetical protein|nr:hypothetical protein [Patescibacteria group bacterium]